MNPLDSFFLFLKWEKWNNLINVGPKKMWFVDKSIKFKVSLKVKVVKLVSPIAWVCWKVKVKRIVRSLVPFSWLSARHDTQTVNNTVSKFWIYITANLEVMQCIWRLNNHCLVFVCVLSSHNMFILCLHLCRYIPQVPGDQELVRSWWDSTSPLSSSISAADSSIRIKLPVSSLWDLPTQVSSVSGHFSCEHCQGCWLFLCCGEIFLILAGFG